MISRQYSLLNPPKKDHGGSTRLGKRKIARPIDPKRPLHVVFRSHRAQGTWSLLNPKHKFHIEQLIYREAKRFGIKLYRFSNVGNHIHLLVFSKNRAQLQHFLRSLTGLIARLVTGAKKGRPVGRFWEALAYSRIVSCGAEFTRVCLYLVKNNLEAFNAITQKEKSSLRMVCRWRVLINPTRHY